MKGKMTVQILQMDGIWSVIHYRKFFNLTTTNAQTDFQRLELRMKGGHFPRNPYQEFKMKFT